MSFQRWGGAPSGRDAVGAAGRAKSKRGAGGLDLHGRWRRVRRLSETVTAAALVALAGAGCGDEDCAVSSTCAGAASGGPGDAPDAGGDGASRPVPPAEGQPSDKSFSFEPVGALPRVMHDTSLAVKLTLQRTPAQTEDVVVTVTNLPTGVTAEPLTIKGAETSGELVVKVAATAKQGPFEANVEGTAPSAKASTKLPLFVRGKAGTVDTTFGTNGRTVSVLGGANAPIRALLVGANDRIYVAGECGSGTCAARLTADGIFDATYGGGAPVAMALPSPRAAALDSQGRLLVGGGAPAPVVGRYLANGQIDTTYAAGEGGSGGVTSGLNRAGADYNPAFGVDALAVGPGDIVYAAFSASTFIGVRKLDSAGKRVLAFGESGTIHFRWSNEARVAGIDAHDGRVTFTGTWKFNTGPQFGLGIAQYNGTSGTYEPAFSTNGGWGVFNRPAALITTPLSGVLRRAPDGRWISAFSENGPKYVARFAADGKALDSSFGTGGRALIAGGGGISDVILQADGKLLVAVFTDGVDRIVRLTANGAPDPSFGASGVLELTPFPGASTRRIGIQSDGRVLVGSVNSEGGATYLTRLWD